MISAKALALLACLVEGYSNDVLNILQALDTLSHTQAEVSEPLVIQSDCPILAEEFNRIWNDSICESLSQGVKIVLMETNETPQTLQDDLLATHVGD